MKLTPNGQLLLDTVANEPGLTPAQLGKRLKMDPANVAALTSEMIRGKALNRVAVQSPSGRPTFCYYTRDAAPPKGEAWSNKLTGARTHPNAGKRVVNGNGNGIDHAPTEGRLAVATVAPSPVAAEPPQETMLLTFAVGRETVTMTVEQARRLYAQLAALFGDRA